jgi:hypothetical protein
MLSSDDRGSQEPALSHPLAFEVFQKPNMTTIENVDHILASSYVMLPLLHSLPARVSTRLELATMDSGRYQMARNRRDDSVVIPSTSQ